MASHRQHSGIFAAPLAVQISAAEHRLIHHRRLVKIRGTRLTQMLYQQLTDPVILFWASGLGFFMGEFTQRPMPQSQGVDRPPQSVYPLFETVLSLIKMVTWAHTLFIPPSSVDGQSPKSTISSIDKD